MDEINFRKKDILVFFELTRCSIPLPGVNERKKINRQGSEAL